MGFVVAILITLAVMGSIMWVMPSPREKRTIAMRNLALAKGMRVRLLDQATAQKMFPWIDDYRGYVLYERYDLNTNRSKGAQKSQGKQGQNNSNVVVVRTDPNFVPHELDEESPLRKQLKDDGVFEQVPASTEAVVQFPGGVSLLWREIGGEEEVEIISSVLDDLTEMA